MRNLSQDAIVADVLTHTHYHKKHLNKIPYQTIVFEQTSPGRHMSAYYTLFSR
jgi:hypothetical protein